MAKIPFLISMHPKPAMLSTWHHSVMKGEDEEKEEAEEKREKRKGNLVSLSLC